MLKLSKQLNAENDQKYPDNANQRDVTENTTTIQHNNWIINSKDKHDEDKYNLKKEKNVSHDVSVSRSKGKYKNISDIK